MFRRILGWFAVVCALVVGGLWVNWQLSEPRHDREWGALYDRQPTVEILDDVFVLDGVRNWEYGADGSTEPAWITAELDPNQLKRIWFIEEPFGEMRAVAHTMLAFEFEDGAAYVASVEARREVNEPYGGLRAGVLPMHEYLVFWTTERDMYANSTFYTGDDLYLFPLDLPPEGARAVLQGMMDLTEELETTPRWYNTFFSNCTNVLARAVNSVIEDAVPWSMAWHLPGYAAEYLYDQGFVAGEGTFETIRAASHLTPRVAPAYEITDPVAFSRAIRE